MNYIPNPKYKIFPKVNEIWKSKDEKERKYVTILGLYDRNFGVKIRYNHNLEIWHITMNYFLFLFEKEN